jgi:hypothetical protein
MVNGWRHLDLGHGPSAIFEGKKKILKGGKVGAMQKPSSSNRIRHIGLLFGTK